MAYFLIRVLISSVFILNSIFAVLNAKDLGTCGTVYPIAEEDIIQYLKNKIAYSGESWMKEFQKSTLEKMKTPKPVSGITKAQEYRTFSFDPSITLTQDVIDHEGQIIAKAGTRINPLDHVSLDYEMIFFDGDDPAQCAFARENKSKKSKWILIKGNPYDLEIQENYPVYFDQQGVLVQKFGIKKVPAKVSQEGSVLKIEEIAL